MTAYSWIPGGAGSSTRDETSREWEEHWTVIGYRPPMGEPAEFGLIADRPEFAPGEPHYNPAQAAKVKSFDADRLGSVADAWEVVVRYRHELQGREENPLSKPAEIDLDAESEEVPIVLDADDKPILNTAGDLIAGLTEEENRWVFNVEVNLPAIPRWLLEYRNAVNADSVRIAGITIDPGYLLFKRPKAGKVDRVKVNGETVEYVPFSFSLIYNPRTWITRVFNRGLWELEWPDPDKPGEGKPSPKPILDDDGDPVTEPQFLDEFGRLPREKVPRTDPDGNPATDPDTGEPLYDDKIKKPLDPADVIVIERWTKTRLPFSRLPIN